MTTASIKHVAALTDRIAYRSRTMASLWRDWLRLAAVGAIYAALLASYYTNPAPRSLAGLVVPNTVAAWLRPRALCRGVAESCARSASCGDAVDRRCAAAAREGLDLASARCHGALFAIETAADAERAADAARACLRRRLRRPFRRAGLPAPALPRAAAG